MIEMWIILGLVLFWLVIKHPIKSKIKMFDNYSHYISKYLDVNKIKKDQEEKN